MRKKLTKHGNSLALIIDKPILDLLEIDAETPLSITTDGRCLIVAPAAGASRRKRFRSAMAEVGRRYEKAFKKLAE